MTLAPLGYGTNLHSAEGVDELIDALVRCAGPLRHRVGWDRLGVDLRLGLRALGDDLRPLRATIDHLGLSAHTINGFPLLPFQVAVVKSDAYRPDWSEAQRIEATLRLIDAALLLSDERFVTISTSPGSWRGFGPQANDHATFASALGAWVHAAAQCEQRLARQVMLCIEPEPGCTLSTTRDLSAFWNDSLRSIGARVVQDLARCSASTAQALLDRHLGVCIDSCHLSVMGEDPIAAISALQQHRIAIGKCQASACPEADAGDPRAVAALLAMAEPRFLHQTMLSNAHGSQWLCDDLDQVAAALHRLPSTQRLRTHFHIPLHAPPLPPLRSTVAETAACVRACIAAGCRHIAVETYTWSLLASECDAMHGTAEELRALAAICAHQR